MRKLLIIGMIAMINVFADERLGFDFSEFDQKSEVLVVIKKQQEKLLGGNYEDE